MSIVLFFISFVKQCPTRPINFTVVVKHLIFLLGDTVSRLRVLNSIASHTASTISIGDSCSTRLPVSDLIIIFF